MSENHTKRIPLINTARWIVFTFALFSTMIYASEIHQVSLEDAVSIALQNNRLHIVSEQETSIAEAQYRQALSSYWPTVDFQASLERRDDDPSFTLPESQLAVPFLGTVPIPAVKAKLFDRDTAIYSLNLLYPLYTGGKRPGIVEQSRIGIKLANQAARRTDLQIVHDVKRYYYACILTQAMQVVADDTVVALEVTRDITQAFYEGGSVSATQRDYLQTEIATSIAQSIAANIKANHQSALAALTHTMGLSVNDTVVITQSIFPETQSLGELDSLIEDAIHFNPEVETLELSIAATRAGIDVARSDYFPTIAIQSSIRHIDNSFNQGLVNRDNVNGWSIGIGLNWSLFNGFRTKNAVSAARLRHQQTLEQRVLVEQGISLKVKTVFQEIKRAMDQIVITSNATTAAEKNVELTNRAYQSGSLKTEDVIQTLLLNSLVSSNLINARHDLSLSLSELEFTLGNQLQ